MAIELDQDIMVTNMCVKFGEDWTNSFLKLDRKQSSGRTNVRTDGQGQPYKTNVMTGSECQNWKTSTLTPDAGSTDHKQSVVAEAMTGSLQFQ